LVQQSSNPQFQTVGRAVACQQTPRQIGQSFTLSFAVATFSLDCTKRTAYLDPRPVDCIMCLVDSKIGVDLARRRCDAESKNLGA
jgi:hypothetical protein